MRAGSGPAARRCSPGKLGDRDAAPPGHFLTRSIILGSTSVLVGRSYFGDLSSAAFAPQDRAEDASVNRTVEFGDGALVETDALYQIDEPDVAVVLLLGGSWGGTVTPGGQGEGRAQVDA